MAQPVILIDSASGSDSAASGAGPTTAVTGSKGRTRNSASQLRVGFFEASPPDLSGVLTDGSHVLYLAISTAGQRNFSSIATVKNTNTSNSSCGVTNGSAVVTFFSTDPAYQVGDIVKVDDGTTTLYSTIASVSLGSSITLNDNWTGSTGSAATVTNPRQLTLTTGQGLNTGSTDTSWAIGGKRATLDGTNSVKLFRNNSSTGDANGWKIQLQSDVSLTSTITITMASWIESDGTRRTITQTINGGHFISAGSGVFKGLKFDNSNGTKTAANVFSQTFGGSPFRCFDCIFGDVSTNKIRSVYTQGTGGTSGVQLFDCEVAGCTVVGFEISSAGNLAIYLINCWVHDIAGWAVSHSAGTSGESLYVIDSIIEGNTSGGFLIRGSLSFLLLKNSIIDGNGGSGIDHQNGALDGIIFNNQITNNNGYGISVGASPFPYILVDGNNYGTAGAGANTSGPTSSLLSMGPNDLTVDPQYADRSGDNFSSGTNVRAKGLPVGGSRTVGANRSATYNYIDMGIQRLEKAPLIKSNLFIGEGVYGT